ncbi:LPS export ABC transporter permease LptG [uncultured Sphingomonas sp.]|uniref:LPS export ABC transporter permease LptG n=1 Tax=uncultured Sphingomonas sp. TaxID=158754 RepID=UPI0025CD3D2A|nr:LPS export ABC transporter permease LptG [uncultured Sphingomonas sp.]
MINLHFFPSRRLAFYTVKLFLTRSFAVLLSLSLVLMTLNLLSESGKILDVPGNGEPELWRYVSLRLPQLISFAFPFSFLLGTLISFAALNQNSEVIAMKAAGLSAHQIIAPLIVTSIALAAVSFAFNELVVTKATRTLSAWDDNDYRPLPPESGILSNVWLVNGEDMVRVRMVAGRGPATRLERLTVFDREGESVVRIIDADRAVPQGDAWRLGGVRLYDSGMNFQRRLPELTALEGVEPERFTLAKVDPDGTDYFSLRQAVEELRLAGRPTAAAEAALWHKLSNPLSTLLMPLLAGVAAFGLARSGKVLLRAAVGMGLGFGFFVADNFALAMGNVGAYPPVLAAWAPFVLFLLIGETVLIRSEE